MRVEVLGGVERRRRWSRDDRARIVEETLAPGAKVSEIARRHGISIVKGERSVTADTALRLARFFGTSPEFWMNLQAMHDLTKARLERGRAIDRDVHPRAA
jgi:addiction module HigA family antidote